MASNSGAAVYHGLVEKTVYPCSDRVFSPPKETRFVHVFFTVHAVLFGHFLREKHSI